MNIPYREGQCQSDAKNEAGSMFKESTNKATEALKKFASRFNINFALSLESDGIFVRTPWDEIIGRVDQRNLKKLMVEVRTRSITLAF